MITFQSIMPNCCLNKASPKGSVRLGISSRTRRGQRKSSQLAMKVKMPRADGAGLDRAGQFWHRYRIRCSHDPGGTIGAWNAAHELAHQEDPVSTDQSGIISAQRVLSIFI